MNRDEFEFGFDPEEEQEARRPKAGNTGHTFVPAFRQAETEGKRPRRSTAFRREQEEDSYMDLDSDFDEEEEIEFGAGSPQGEYRPENRSRARKKHRVQSGTKYG